MRPGQVLHYLPANEPPPGSEGRGDIKVIPLTLTLLKPETFSLRLFQGGEDGIGGCLLVVAPEVLLEILDSSGFFKTAWGPSNF